MRLNMMNISRLYSNEQNTALANILTTNVFSPRLLALRHETNLETAKQLQPMIEEGMADGSIKQGNAKLLAELFMLLVNFWMYPNLFPGDNSEIEAKVKMIKQIFDMLGFPIMDETLGKLFFTIVDELGWQK